MILFMYRLSVTSFSVARVFMALAVFFCHVFEPFNSFGFLFVGVFFFMSGYGMEYGRRRLSALTRLIPLLFFFLLFSLVYWFRFSVFIYPTSWFLVVYFVVMLIYRFVSNRYLLFFSFLFLSLFFYLFEFNWVWYASFGAFYFGFLFARFPRSFTLTRCLSITPLFFPLYLTGYSSFLWFLLPLFSYFVLSVSSLSFFRFLSVFSPYTFFFYCIHCFFLGLFGSTWTLGGSPEFWCVLLSFLLSVFFSIFFKDYLFKYAEFFG